MSNLKYQQLLRLRKRGDERITNAKNSRQELPSVSGNSMSGGDIEKDRANADLCTHTPFYSRAALSLHRVKYESGKRTFNESYQTMSDICAFLFAYSLSIPFFSIPFSYMYSFPHSFPHSLSHSCFSFLLRTTHTQHPDMLRIIIRNLPDDGVLVELIICPHVITLAHLNLLYVSNSKDPTAGLCLEGRVSPLVLIVPTEEGAFHIDLRQENVTDLHGFYNFSPGSATVLSELKFRNAVLSGPPDTLLLLRVPVLSNIAVRQLLTVFLSVNTSMKIEANSRAVRLLRNKMFEIPYVLPGNDCIQSYMTPLMLRKREVKRMIAAQVRAEEKALEDEQFRLANAEQQRQWKQARRDKNRAVALKRQAAELAEKRRLENIKMANKKAEAERIAKRKKEKAKQAMLLLRAGGV